VEYERFATPFNSPSKEGVNQDSIKTGLPAEIAARHKQYEYYRDQLLTFKPNPLSRGGLRA
jgi:hypothetical protein